MIDWIAGAFELTGSWIIGNKNKYAFVCWMICGVLWAIVAFKTGVYGLLIVVIPSFFMNMRNFCKWCRTNGQDIKNMTNYERFCLLRRRKFSIWARKRNIFDNNKNSSI